MISNRNVGRATAVLLAILIAVVSSVLSGGEASAELPAGGTFTDDNGNVHEGYIEAIREAGLTNGCSADGTKYCPSQGVTRAEMAAFIVRSLGSGTNTAHNGYFPDVAAGAWYSPYVERLFEIGVTNGYADGLFRPDSVVSRAEMAALLVRAFDNLDVNDANRSFSDISHGAWYAGYAEGLLASEVTKGCATSPLQYCPASPVQRDQMASFVGRALGLTPITPPAPPVTVPSGLPEIHVDGSNPSASDGNAGSSDQPLRSIQEAVDRSKVARQNGQAVTIIVHPGTYREEVKIGYAGSNPPPLVVEASQPGTAVVSGADVWTGWSYDPGTNSYVHEWPFDWGQAGGVEPIVGRREMVFVGGKRLDQVLGTGSLGLGTFSVDEGSNRIHVRVSSGNVTTAEVAVRGRTLTMDGAQNVTIRGMTFTGAASPFESSSVEVVNGGNHLLDSNVITQNNWVGLGVTTLRDVTLTNNIVNENGGGGMGVYQAPGLVMDSNTTSYNNWRGVRGDYVGWSIGAVKMVGQHDTVISNHVSVGNQTRGFWVDYDITNISIRDSRFTDNLTDGLFIEAAQGPVTVSNTVMSGNGRYGALVVNTDSTTIESSTMCGNGKSAIRIDSEPGGRTVQTANGSVWLPAARDLTLLGNTFGLSERVLDSNVPGDHWGTFTSTLTSGNNTWIPLDPSNAFVFNGSKGDFSSWKAATGQDSTSTIGVDC